MKKYFFILTIVFLLSGCQKNISDKNMFKNIREAKTAGQFYPADADELKNKITEYLENVPKASSTANVGAVVVPHAGYDFSGSVAAYAYKRLVGKKVNTVIIMCNSHAVYFEGVAVDNHDAWQTPLGEVAVDKELAQKLVASDKSIQYNQKPFTALDQTIEVQIPFLQTVLKPDFKILPIYFGNTGEEDYKKLAKALVDNLDDSDVIVASTDMSHYPSYEDANKIDQASLEVIKLGEAAKLNEHIDKVISQGANNEETAMCGIDGVRTILEVFNLKKWDGIEILKYANSGDVSGIGDKRRVVGYGAIVFTAPASNNLLNDSQKQELLIIARQTVNSFVKNGQIHDFYIDSERLNRKEGAFVTIHKDRQLRGCIGQIISTEKPLWQVVRDMAVAAASEDNRFFPVEENELDKLSYEISVLSAPELIDDWQKIKLGENGVIIKQDGSTGVFLPQVATETGWSKEEILRQLCTQKAGLPASCYKDKDVKLYIFTAQVFSG